MNVKMVKAFLSNKNEDTERWQDSVEFGARSYEIKWAAYRTNKCLPSSYYVEMEVFLWDHTQKSIKLHKRTVSQMNVRPLN